MVMRLTVKQLRNLICEAIGDRGWPGDKAHLICYVIAQGGGQMTRVDVMKKVHEIEGKDPASFKATTNQSYWLPAEVMRTQWQRDEQGQLVMDPETHRYIDLGRHMVPNDAPGAGRSGVLIRGLVKAVGKRGNTLVYGLTEKGQQFADETAAFFEKNPEAMGDIAPKPPWMNKRDRDAEQPQHDEHDV